MQQCERGIATRDGGQLRAAARLMALTGQITGNAPLVTVALIANLAALAAAVAELRQAQQHAAQAAAARAAASHLHAWTPGRAQAPQGQAQGQQPGRSATAAWVARDDFPASPRPGHPEAAAPARAHPPPGRGPLPPRRAGPGR